MKHNRIHTMTMAATLMFSGTVLAHTGGHSMAGLLGGMMHPLTGLDHLAAMLVAGCWIGMGGLRHAGGAVIALLLLMALGVVWGIGGLVLPAVETGIAASLLVPGLLLALSARLSTATGMAMTGLFALVHGNAHGVEMPLFADGGLYVTGLLLSSGALLLAGLWLARRLRAVDAGWLSQGLGAISAGGGLLLLIGA